MKICKPKYGHGSGFIVDQANFLRKDEFIDISNSRDIPHWHQSGVMQFVTFRLNDSIPKSKLNQFKETKEEWFKRNPRPWTFEQIIEYEDLIDNLDKWLNSGHGSCILKYDEVQRIVEDSLTFFDGVRYELHDYIIMPNHVHMLIIPEINYSISEILHSIKSFSAHQINKILNRKGKLWQKESFDRMIRSHSDFFDKKEYIKHNGNFIG